MDSSTQQLAAVADWQQVLAAAVRDSAVLLRRLQLEDSKLASSIITAREFPLLVPEPFLAKMRIGDAQDPLLRQVLPVQDELDKAAGFSLDPLGELQSNVRPGLIHKYQGRVLLLAATGCAINCRYCFRRHFPYADNRLGSRQWQQALEYVAADSSISEVILSGGDPLLLNDAQLAKLVAQIAAIPHVRRLRIHSRLPVVIPQRLTAQLQACLQSSRLQCSLVLHVNHPHELGAEHLVPLAALRSGGVCLLNQSVLLAGVNDDAAILCQLSELLFDYGVLPYYLHSLDLVQGAQHFAVERGRALQLHRQMHALLPGYLLPRLVQEIAGEPGKTLL